METKFKNYLINFEFLFASSINKCNFVAMKNNGPFKKRCWARLISFTWLVAVVFVQGVELLHHYRDTHHSIPLISKEKEKLAKEEHCEICHFYDFVHSLQWSLPNSVTFCALLLPEQWMNYSPLNPSPLSALLTSTTNKGPPQSLKLS